MTDTASRRSALRPQDGTITVAAAATGGLAPHAHAAGRPRHGAGPRVERLLAELTLDEKISLPHGATGPASLGQAGHVPGVARFGIPPSHLADGPVGVRATRIRVWGGRRRLTPRAGERKRVTVPVAARTLSSWDPERHDWVSGTGRREVWIGAPAEDPRLRTRAGVAR